MNRYLITAFASLLPDGGLPDEIVYLPEGNHAITPFVDGKPKKITVRVPAAKGAQIAASLQADLEKRQAANVRPWFDFEHKGGASSALPRAFRYEPGKGVMCALEWTGAGRAAIEGKDFSYFSPTFLLDDDGTPAGLPDRGPLGALVNEPAFREIPRIAASDAAADDPEPTSAMSKLIFAALAISAAHADAETLAVQAIEALKTDAITAKDAQTAAEKARDQWKTKAEAAEAEVAKARKERADTLVKAAVADGRIPAKDIANQDKFRAKIEAGDSFAEDVLAMLPRQHAGLGTPIIQAGATGHPAGGGTEPVLMTKAKALVAAGDAKTLDDAIGQVAAAEPAAYSDYLKSLS